MHEQSAKSIHSLADRLRGTILSPRCATAEEAEQIADRVAKSLGLDHKKVLQESYAFAYEDATRNVRLEVEIGHANYHGPVDCWGFQCSAGRIGDSLRLRPEHHYRKIPANFASDAESLVRAVLAGEVERQVAVKETAEKRRSEVERIKARVAPGREVDILERWFDDKKYGFFEGSGKRGAFVHIRDVKAEDRKHLREGEIFSFKREWSEKGWKAVEVEYAR